MAQFVVLHHVCPPDDSRPTHWDLMLESVGSLRTWALAKAPPLRTTIVATRENDGIAAEPLPAHRLEYLRYEGPLSGGRGEVARWDQGEYRVLSESPDEILIDFQGSRLQGQYKLWRESPVSALEQNAQNPEPPNQGRMADYWLFGLA